MSGTTRWSENWRAIGPPGAVRAEVGRSRASRRRLEREVADLPAGTPVVLAASGPGTLGRCRAFAAAAGLDVDREFLALPTATAPAYLVEDAPGPAAVLLRSVLVTPPGARFPTLLDLAFGAVRVLRPWRLIRLLAPGRVVVTTRRA